MVKPNELRIGNWVLHNNKPITVSAGILSSWAHLLDVVVDVTVGSIEPVPITGKVLLESGFTLLRSRPNEEIFGTEDGFYATYSKNPDHPFDPGKWVVGEVAEIPVTSLHELQNAYFAYRKKELPIKYEKLQWIV